MFNILKRIFKKRNKCITILCSNREVVRIKRVKDYLSLQNYTRLSKYFIGAKSISPTQSSDSKLTVI